MLTQIEKRSGRIDRVPPGVTPVLELNLEPGEHIAGVELRQVVLFHSERKTTDWTWTAYVVTPLPGPDA